MANIITIPEGAIVEDIDLYIDKQTTLQMVNVRQYDSGMRYIRASIWNDGDLYPMVASDTICLTATKPDRNPLFNQAGIDSEGRILYEMTDQTTSAFGVFIAEFRIYNTKEVDGTTVNTLKSTYDFKINVAKSNVQDTEIVSTPEFNALTDAMASVGDLITDVTDAVERVNNALIDTGIAINNANTKANLANEKAILADEKATQANDAAVLANEKAGLADTATSNANAATTNANTATTNAITATSNANTATINAQNAADYANDVATILDNETLKIFKPAVSTYTDLSTTYPIPENGWTVTVTDETVSYRYNGTEWINLGVISSVDTATNTTLGIVKGGGNINIGTDGTISVPSIGDINQLETVSTELVGAINEVNAKPSVSTAEDVTYGESNVKVILDNHSSQLAEIPNQLASKADKTYVDTLTSSIASGSPKGTYATLSALQSAFPTGNTNIYVITADGNWYYWNGVAWTQGGIYLSSDTDKAKKLMATNLVTNGDFSQGTTGWYGNDATLSVVNNILSITNKGTIADPFARPMLDISLPSSDVYFYYYKGRVTNSLCSSLTLRIYNGVHAPIVKQINNPTQNVWYELYGIYDWSVAGIGSGTQRIDLRHAYVDAATASGKVLEAQYVTAINLTETFGTGNEPTSEQMYKLLSGYTNKWFNGTSEILPLKSVNALITQTVGKFATTNSIVNGDFSEGVTGWASVGNTLSVSNKVMKETLGSAKTYGDLKQTTPIFCTTNRKIYIRAKVRTLDTNCAKISIKYFGTTNGATTGSGTLSVSIPKQNIWYDLYGVISLTSAYVGNLRIAIIQEYSDTVAGRSMEVQYVTAIDLTETFGTGNEPNSNAMDKLLSKYPNKWFNGTSEILPLKSVNGRLYESELSIDNAAVDIERLKQKIAASNDFLRIPSPYNDGTTDPWANHQVTHPSVVQFDTAWNGYIYWMAFTPFPHGNPPEENPCLAASNDGIKWVVPEGIINPIDGMPENGYNSDTHIFYRSDLDQLEVWYRTVKGGDTGEIIKRVIISNNLTVSSPATVIETTIDGVFVKDILRYVSPSIMYENGVYKLWCTHGSYIHYSESSDLITWTELKPVRCNNMPILSWHSCIVKNDAQYHMVNNQPNSKEIRYSVSTDGKTFGVETTVIKHETNAYRMDGKGLYRATPIWLADGSVGIIYGMYSQKNDWTMGMSVGEDFYNLRGIDHTLLEYNDALLDSIAN